MASSIFLIASCPVLSMIVGIPNGLNLPLAFWINTLLTGFGYNF